MNAGKTMNCPECGHPAGETDQFCSKCFARLKPPGLWQKFLSLFRSTGASRPARPVINIEKRVTIKTAGEDGQPHEYHSLEEVPPGLRAEIERLESDLMKEKCQSVSFAETSATGNVTKSRIVSRKSFQVFKIKDATGQETIYHSLDEVPREKRSQLENLESDAMKEADLLSAAALEQAKDGQQDISIYTIRDASGQERTYHSLDELPPDLRALVENAKKQFDEQK